ncbi:MAG: hypothetical protein ACE5GJ_06320 [Gemmatimonadota bacterium]
MKQYIGFFIGTVYYLIAFGALKNAFAGWGAGHSDLGFWWTVIAGLLAIAGTGAFVGTWIHSFSHHDHQGSEAGH